MHSEKSAGDQLRELAAGLDNLEIPAAVRMVLPGGLDLDGARQVLDAAADQLDRLDEIDRRLTLVENQR